MSQCNYRKKERKKVGWVEQFSFNPSKIENLKSV